MTDIFLITIIPSRSCQAEIIMEKFFIRGIHRKKSFVFAEKVQLGHVKCQSLQEEVWEHLHRNRNEYYLNSPFWFENIEWNSHKKWWGIKIIACVKLSNYSAHIYKTYTQLYQKSALALFCYSKNICWNTICTDH